MTILRPGDYYFEVETAPSVDKGSLYQMLQSVGFGLVVFDQEDDALSAFSVGALPTGLPGAKTPAVSSSLTSFRPSASRSVVTPTVKAAATAVAPPPPPPKTPITSLSRKPAAPPPPPVNPKLSSVVPSTVRKAAAVPIPKARPFKVRPPSPPQSQPPPQASPPSPEVTYAEAPPVQEYVEESVPGGGAGEGYNFTPPSPGETEASPAPVEDERLPAPIVETLEGIKASLLLLWQRWAEWGSPFLSGPRVSGEGGNRFRFMGSIPVEMELNDTPILKWLYAQKVGFNPWDSLRQNFIPTPLLHGKVYEFRILAHDRTTPTRDSVKEALGRMGFAPMKLINLKRHMRMPGRPGASLSLWWGMGQWASATSVVTQDEPFIFDELREVQL